MSQAFYVSYTCAYMHADAYAHAHTYTYTDTDTDTIYIYIYIYIFYTTHTTVSPVEMQTRLSIECRSLLFFLNDAVKGNK